MYSLRRSRLSLSLALRRKRARENGENSKRFLTSFHAHVLFTTTRQIIRRNTTQTEQSRTLEVVSVFDAERRARVRKTCSNRVSRHRFSLKHIIRCCALSSRLDTSARTRRRLQRSTENTEDDSKTNATPTSTKYSFLLSRRFVLHFFETRNA